MGETGLLPAQGRTELWDGQIIDMMPIGPFHAGTVISLTDLFAEHNRRRWLISVQSPLLLDDYSMPEPDLMLLRRDTDHFHRKHPTTEDVLLLVEVSDSSLSYDRLEKIPGYGRAGIPEVWLVNLPQRCVEVYRQPHYTGYQEHLVFDDNQTMAPQAFPDAVILVAELLGSAKRA